MKKPLLIVGVIILLVSIFYGTLYYMAYHVDNRYDYAIRYEKYSEALENDAVVKRYNFYSMDFYTDSLKDDSVLHEAIKKSFVWIHGGFRRDRDMWLNKTKIKSADRNHWYVMLDQKEVISLDYVIRLTNKDNGGASIDSSKASWSPVYYYKSRLYDTEYDMSTIHKEDTLVCYLWTTKILYMEEEFTVKEMNDMLAPYKHKHDELVGKVVYTTKEVNPSWEAYYDPE